ncbi:MULTISPECIES: GNAT family N-acetyltransferase [unclassified Brevibacterium]|uniref:GNAT family N-acetyltransferase n=1 Tax=unclassified Brevibacterium TaxID=2614124 RepID=UPI001E2AFDF1|nr:MULTISPECIES: GNAT family N-acetyltransferase [unclassified Brevibacterium]MDK8436385.1 GNAT family N-acetyltransferase [Brevibacterium sp. H-BE7]
MVQYEESRQPIEVGTAMYNLSVIERWIPPAARKLQSHQAFVAVTDHHGRDQGVSILRVQGGPTIVTTSAELASQFGLRDSEIITAQQAEHLVETDGLAYDPQEHIRLLYVPEDRRAGMQEQESDSRTRRLTQADEKAFSDLTKAAPQTDLDEALVELDDWLVYGTFVNESLASVSSMYILQDTQIADIGVITLSRARRNGLAKATVRAITADALAQGAEPQYRCQFDNAASTFLASAVGFELFADWRKLSLVTHCS